MKKRGSVFVIVCSLVMVTLFLFSSSFTREATAQTKTFKFGLISSMTGPMAPAFKNITDAAKPAEDLMNKRGGITIKGQKYLIEIVAEDDQSSPPGAVAAINKMIQDGIKFVYAPQATFCNIALAPAAEEAKILRIKGLGVGKEEVGPSFRFGATVSNVEKVAMRRRDKCFYQWRA